MPASTTEPHTIASPIVPARLAEWVSRLRVLFGKINAADVDICAREFDKRKWAKDAGEELIAVKKDVGHGKFLPWLKENTICAPRTATNYMAIAAGWTVIEAESARRADLNIKTALQLLRPKKPARPKQDGVSSPRPTSPKDPYSVEALQKLSADARARLIENLGLTRADVSAGVQAEIAQHDADQRQRVIANQQAETNQVQAQRLSIIRTTLATSARPECKLETIENVFAVEHSQPVMDHGASRFIVKPEIIAVPPATTAVAAVPPDPSCPQISNTDGLDIPGFLDRAQIVPTKH